MSKLTPRQLRDERNKRIAARKNVKAGDDAPPAWLEKKIGEGEPMLDPSDPSAQGDGEELLEPVAAGEELSFEPSAAGDELPPPAVGDEDPSDPSALGEEPSDMLPAPAACGEVKSAFMYNPLYQKPAALGPRGYKSGYHYFGPPPDAGTSYGYYLDADSKIGIITPVSKGKVFSPITGKSMKFMGKVETDGLATVLAVSDQMIRFKVGKDTRVTSAPLLSIQSPKVFDSMTGQDISKTVSLLKAGDGEQVELPPAEGEPSDDPSDPSAMGDDMLFDPSAEGEPSELALPPAEGQPVIEPVGQGEMPLQGEEEPTDMPPAEGEPSDVDPSAEGEPSDEDVEAVQYEALQSADGMEGVSESDVHMTLFDEEASASPYWNIDIKGMPVGRVYLKDQPKPEEIREVFCSADYHRGVAGAIEKVGINPVLKQLKAHLWANEIEKTKLATTIKAKVEADAKERVTALTKNLMKDLMNRIAIVCAGMDKNFYKEHGNPLKESLWAELHAFGITNPSPMIEAAFRKGSTKYFETVLSKAVEYMEMNPEALVQIKAAIGDMDVLPAGDNSPADELPEALPAPEQAPTLSQRLAASSVAVAGIPTVVGNAIGDHKQSLRRELSLGGAGPRLRR